MNKYRLGQDLGRSSLLKPASLPRTEHDSARGWSARCTIWARAERFYNSHHRSHSSCIRSFTF